jgi:hypothetical protein
VPESTAQDTVEIPLILGSRDLASHAGVLTYWDALLWDPSFILTNANAPTREVALETLMDAVKQASNLAPDTPIVLVECWPDIDTSLLTTGALADWKKKIEVDHGQYLAMVLSVQEAFPALEIQVFPLASALLDLLETPVLSSLDITDLFAPDTPQGTPALLTLAAMLTGSTLSPTHLPASGELPDTLPKVPSENYAEVVELAHLDVGDTPQGTPALLTLAAVLTGSTLSPTHLPASGELPDTLPKVPSENYAEVVELAHLDVGGMLVTMPDTDVIVPEPTELEIITNFMGSDANDLIDLTADLRQIDGGGGIDTLRVAALSKTAILTRVDTERMQLGLADNELVVLEHVERIAFEDGTLAFDDEGLAGQAYRLYQACFDRTPDTEGLGFWVKQLDAGNVTMTQAADFFIGSEEFANVYGPPEALPDVHYLSLLYANVLDRVPDSEGFVFWRDQQSNGITRADMLVYFSESTENVARVAPAIDDGIWYI